MQSQGKKLCFLEWHKERHRQDSAEMRYLSRTPEVPIYRVPNATWDTSPHCGRLLFSETPIIKWHGRTMHKDHQGSHEEGQTRQPRHKHESVVSPIDFNGSCNPIPGRTSIQSEASQQSSHKMHQQKYPKRDGCCRKKQHDQHAKDLSNLNTGRLMRVQDHDTRKWTPAIVRQACTEPRSYIIETPTV